MLEAEYRVDGMEQPLSPKGQMAVYEVPPEEREAWNSFVAGADNGHVLQSWAWGEYKRRSGWKPIRLAVSQDGNMCAAAQMLVRSVAGISFAYVPRGPVVPPGNVDAFSLLLDELHRYARRYRSVLLRIEPNESSDSGVGAFLRSRGFLVSPRSMRPTQPWATLMVDLAGGADAVQNRMHKRTRQYVRTLERKLVVRTGMGDDDIIRFHQLATDVAMRRNITVKPLAYYSDLLEALGPEQAATLLLAEVNGEAVAGVIITTFGAEGIALHSGSSSAHLNTRANHLLQWKAMQWCMTKGCTRYDLWGVFERRQISSTGEVIYLPLTEDDIKPELRGIYRFKKSFGGEPVRYIGAFNYPYIRPLYSVWSSITDLQTRLTTTVRTARTEGWTPAGDIQRFRKWVSGTWT